MEEVYLAAPQKKARERRAVMVFVDESALSLIPYSAKTWAPVGQTPVLRHQGAWPKVSAIGGITPRGRLYLKVRKGTIRAPEVVTFLMHLLRHIRRRPVMVFWDSGQPHRSKLVQGFLEEHPRLEVHRLPGYSPELNPEEWVWAHLKKHELANFAPHNLKELKRGVRLAVMRMRDRPRLVWKLGSSSELPD